MADIRLIQLARIFGVAKVEDEGSARALIAARSAAFADALFAEAADNDDVTSSRAALDYLDGRLAEFSGLIEIGTAGQVRAAFMTRLAAWGDP